jgi:hypothetical protein
MKTIALIFVTSGLLCAQSVKSPSQKASTAAAPAIPDGAKQIEPFLYRYIDAQGKTWMYRKYPFGVMKWEEQAAPAAPAPDSRPVGVTDLGDSFRFETKTPFGPQVWTKKKSELTDDEKSLVSRDQQNRRPLEAQPSGDKASGAGETRERH